MPETVLPPGGDLPAPASLAPSLPVLCGLGVLLGLAERVPGLTAAGLALILGAYPMVLGCLTRDRGEARLPRPPGDLLRWFGLLTGLAAGLVLGSVLDLGTLALRSPAWAGGLLAVTVCGALATYHRRGQADYWRLPLLAAGMVLGFGMSVAEPPDDVPEFVPGLIDAAVTAATAIVPGVGIERASVVSGAHDCALMLAQSPLDWRVALFVLVAVSGFMVFGQGLLRTWARFPAATEAVLLGALLGGLVRLWPWQLVTAYTLGPSGAQLAPSIRAVLPGAYEAHTGVAPAILPVVAVALLAAAATMVLLPRLRAFVAARPG